VGGPKESNIVPGEAVQVEPMKPKLQAAPGTERLKLKYDILLSSFAVNFNLRHYSLAWQHRAESPIILVWPGTNYS